MRFELHFSQKERISSLIMKKNGKSGRILCVFATLIAMQGYERRVQAAENELTDEERDFGVRLQVYLDRAGFAPGKIDGRTGTFTMRALQNLIAARGWTNGLGETFMTELTGLDPLYVEYEIRDEDRKWIGSVPSSRSAQSRRGRLPYTSLAEFVTERFHTSPVLIKELNPEVNIYGLKPGDRIRVPNVVPFKIETLTSLIENGPPHPPMLILDNRVLVSLKDKIARVYDADDRLLASFPITAGSSVRGMRTPRGEWKVANVVVYPNFRYDRSMLKTGRRSKNYVMLPPGPNNPVGVAWMGLNRSGIGLHGTNNPRTIGRAVSHGCMRLANWDAVRLMEYVQPETPVTIE